MYSKELDYTTVTHVGINRLLIIYFNLDIDGIFVLCNIKTKQYPQQF